MMNLFTDFESRIKNVLENIDIVREKRGEVVFARVGVEPPRDPSHGDVATNAAMVLAKPLGSNPRALAELIVAELKKDPEIADVSVAGPGFINVRLSVDYWQKVLATIIAEGGEFRSGRRSPTNMAAACVPCRKPGGCRSSRTRRSMR